jgi:hypothetical protein
MGAAAAGPSEMSAVAFRKRLIITALIAVGLAGGSCIAYGIAAGADVASGSMVIVTSLALLGTSFVVGGLLGLLFGLPRDVDIALRRQASSARFSFNSNLLKVSDWITTIVVGLTLVNLGRIPGALESFGSWIAPSLGGKTGSAQFGILTLMFGTTLGFIMSFTYTTLVFRQTLETSEQEVESKWRELGVEYAAGKKSDEDLQKELESASATDLAHIREDPLLPTGLTELAKKVERGRSRPDVS